MGFKFISEENKSKISKSFNELKKEWKNVKNKLGISSVNNNSKENEDKKTKDLKPKTKIEKKKESLKENIGIINCLVFMFFVLIVILANNLFVNDMPFFGILALLLIPLFICLEIYVCLKYTNMTLKEHYKFAEKKYGKDKIKVFGIICFIFLFMVSMIILAI